MITKTELYNLSTDIANCTFGSIYLKSELRRAILKLTCTVAKDAIENPNIIKEIEDLLIYES